MQLVGRMASFGRCQSAARPGGLPRTGVAPAAAPRRCSLMGQRQQQQRHPRLAAGSDSSQQVETMRSSQRRATDLLAVLLQAPDPAAAARQYAGSLDEGFFMTASAYMALAEKDGNADVASRLKTVMQVAWSEVQQRLPEEVRLLNSLVNATDEGRKQLYNDPATPPALEVNEGSFFKLLARMLSDVERQPPNPGKAPLVLRLRAIQRETTALAKMAAKGKAK